MTVEDSDGVFQQLLGQLREVLPEVARQIEDEVARGRGVGALALPESDRTDREERLRFAGSRISKEDLASVAFTGDERLTLLITAVMKLGSSMTASREAIARLTGRQELRPGTVQFRSEAAVDAELAITPELEAQQVSAAFADVSQPLQTAMDESR